MGSSLTRRRTERFIGNPLSIVPIRDCAGAITYFLAVKEDISERKQAEEELYRSRQMLQSILDNIPQRVFWKDRSSIYLGCNRAFATDVGLGNPAEIVGRGIFGSTWARTGWRMFIVPMDKLVMEQGAPKPFVRVRRQQAELHSYAEQQNGARPRA